MLDYAGVQHFELGQLDEALRHYDLAIKNDKNQTGAFLYNRGLVYSRLDRIDEAIADYTEANKYLTEQEYQYQCKFNRGIQYRRAGRLEESIRDLQDAVKIKNDKPSAYNNLALSQFEYEDWPEALANYDKAINLCPSAVHYNNRGLAHYHNNSLQKAKDDFDKAKEIDPNDPTIYFNRGNVFLNWDKGDGPDYENALRDYEMAISLAPNNAKLWHSKGLAYQSESEKLTAEKSTDQEKINFLNQKAIESYQQALKLQESFASSRFHLGLMYHRISAFPEALKCFSKVLKKVENDKTVFIARGCVYYDMGNHKLAIDDFDKAIEDDDFPEKEEDEEAKEVELGPDGQPIDPAAAAALAPPEEEYADPAKRSASLATQADGYFRRGLCKYAQKHYNEAIKDFKAAKAKEDALDEMRILTESNWGI